MNKKISLGVAISLIAITAAITFILTSSFSLQTFNEKVKAVKEKAEKYQRLDELDTYVRDNFYKDIDETELMNAILKGYINGVDDKYARYLTPQEYKETLAEDSGTLVGIGITVTKDETGYIKIVEIMDESPAKGSELKAGDIIVAVDGIDVLSIEYADAVEAVKGTEGTVVRLTIRRDGVDKDYEFTRQSIETVTVTGKMLKDNIGYIQVTKFNSTTGSQFTTELNKLIDDGAKSFVFDMRNNSGGLVSAVETCLDPLLPEGDIAKATYKDGHQEIICASTDGKNLDMPMMVLVNGKTASAAELFAASLRDFGKAELIGVNTFGKGIMQNTVALDDGGAVTLTVAKYQTVKSECYNGIGLAPDYEVALPSDKGAVVEEGAEEEDIQLQKAIELLV